MTRISIRQYSDGEGGIALTILPDDDIGEKLAEKLGKELPKLHKQVIERSHDCMWGRRRCVHVTFHVSGDKRVLADDIKKIVEKIVKGEKINAQVYISDPF